MAATEWPWFRFYSSAIGDKKLSMVARVTGMSFLEVLGALAALLCLANESPERGKLMLTKALPMAIEDIAEALHCNVTVTLQLLQAFQQAEILDLVGQTWTVINWDSRQRNGDNSAERVRKHRAAKRDGNVTVTLQGVTCNGVEKEGEREGEGKGSCCDDSLVDGYTPAEPQDSPAAAAAPPASSPDPQTPQDGVIGLPIEQPASPARSNDSPTLLRLCSDLIPGRNRQYIAETLDCWLEDHSEQDIREAIAAAGRASPRPRSPLNWIDERLKARKNGGGQLAESGATRKHYGL